MINSFKTSIDYEQKRPFEEKWREAENLINKSCRGHCVPHRQTDRHTHTQTQTHTHTHTDREREK